MANKKKNHDRNQLYYGEFKYVCGGRTMVKLIGDFEADKPICKVFEVGPTSKFLVGDEVRISRRCLYPYKRKYLKKTGKWDEVFPTPDKPPLKQLEI